VISNNPTVNFSRQGRGLDRAGGWAAQAITPRSGGILLMLVKRFTCYGFPVIGSIKLSILVGLFYICETHRQMTDAAVHQKVTNVVLKRSAENLLS